MITFSRRAVLGIMAGSVLPGIALAEGDAMVQQQLRTAHHTTSYLTAGPVHGPLMIFVHGWPEIGLLWRAQIEHFASTGWHCVAPDMRGYGASSAPARTNAYAISEIVADMVELHDHLGGAPAVWVGHDWGSPVVGAIAANHAQRCRGAVLISVPYLPDAFALPTLIPLVDRTIYPADTYADGQWDYFRFYQTDFDQAASDYEADIPATLASIYKPGSPAAAGKVSPTASVRKNGGRFGAAHRAPPTPPDPSMWPKPDFDALVAAFSETGFRPADAWYLNDAANIACARLAPDHGRLHQPVLFLNGVWDPICNIRGGRLGDPMRAACSDLTVVDLQSGHWLPLERKGEVNDAIGRWLHDKRLNQGEGP